MPSDLDFCTGRVHGSGCRTKAVFRAGLLGFFLGLMPMPAWASEQWDQVEEVWDGDTVTLRMLGRARLLGVDCPEVDAINRTGEHFGVEAAEYARKRLSGRRVKVEFDYEERDRYRRALVYLSLEDGTLFNQELVLNGYAYAYVFGPLKYKFILLRAEDEARSRRRGMWAVKERSLVEGPLHGNTRSLYYHSPNCRNYNCSNCTAVFEGREEAEKQGYKPHWGCIGSR